MSDLFELSAKIRVSRLFKNSITVVILVAAILVGIDTYQDFAAEISGFLYVANKTVLVIFIVEILIKILAERNKPWNYFNNGWNIFDFFVVAAVFLPFFGSSIAVLRLLRLLRVFRLVNVLPKLQVLVLALLHSIPSMLYVSLLLGLLFYVYGVAAVTFFSENDPVHFQDLHTSILSLFRVVTLEDWTDIMYINMYGCENYGYDGIMENCNNSKGYPLGAALFFVSFVLLGTMIILNLFIGVIMNGMEEARKIMDEQDKQLHPENNLLIDLREKLREVNDLVKKLEDN